MPKKYQPTMNYSVSKIMSIYDFYSPPEVCAYFGPF